MAALLLHSLSPGWAAWSVRRWNMFVRPPPDANYSFKCENKGGAAIFVIISHCIIPEHNYSKHRSVGPALENLPYVYDGLPEYLVVWICKQWIYQNKEQSFFIHKIMLFYLHLFCFYQHLNVAHFHRKRKKKQEIDFIFIYLVFFLTSMR